MMKFCFSILISQSHAIAMHTFFFCSVPCAIECGCFCCFFLHGLNYAYRRTLYVHLSLFLSQSFSYFLDYCLSTYHAFFPCFFFTPTSSGSLLCHSNTSTYNPILQLQRFACIIVVVTIYVNKSNKY